MSRHILAISKEVPLCPPVPSQKTDQEARPIHILLLGAHLIIRSHSLSLLPRSLCSLSFNFPHYTPRLASENWSRLCRTILLWYITLLGPYQMCQWKLWAAVVGSFVLWHNCSPPPITETLSILCWAQIRSAGRLWISTGESSHCSHCSRLQILDWQAILVLLSS